ncbi:DUF4397 domain-containing protein [Natronogracilivirga saccharolytica]|uniref:DUF4397 domain-containing protein n=1 Tax=Natronogracilivirga saccharolytica TaxID=2812953 RepID=A0A8J7UW49_9BACT|nr:DUF4397 domain-containing protein [Natronogracilivirga saccharolytica]MBP3193247.1 DUF4397 domain-containing protein [Natronogracilivirga saccharolytica]
MTRLFLNAIAVVLLVFTLHACDIFEADNEYPDGKASVRVVNIAPEAVSPVSYFQKDEVVFTGLEFGDMTDFADVAVGRNIDGFLDDQGDTLIVRDEMADKENDIRFFDFERSFTVFAMHGPDSTGNVRIRSMEIEDTPNREGYSRVRVLHAVSGLDVVDVYLTEPNEGIDQESLFAFDIGFNNEGGSSDPDDGSAPAEMPLYSNVEPGVYNLKLTLADDTDVIFEEEVEFDESRNYTMVLYPNEDNDDIERVLLVADN